MVAPASWACCRNFAIPAAPCDSIGKSCWADPPKTAVARAARSAGSLTPAMALASVSNCWSGVWPLSLSAVSPSRASESIAPASTRVADASTPFMDVTAPSIVDRLAPVCCAAKPSSLRASTLAPVRLLILSSSSPVLTNDATAAASGAAIPAPAAMIDAPTACMLLPAALNVASALRSDFTNAEFFTYKVTYALPASMSFLLAMLCDLVRHARERR